MLGKLIKHEIRATGRIIPMFYIAIVTTFLTGLIGNLIDNSYLHGLATFLMIISIFAINIVTLVVVVTRYYKNLFGNEGYLTGTLPVDKSLILATKIIVGIGWIILKYIATAFCTFGLLFINNEITLELFQQSLFELVKTLFNEQYVRSTIFYFLATIIIQTMLFIAKIYCAITIAHTKPFIKHSVGFSILWYFIIGIIIDSIDAILIFIPFGINVETGHIVTETMLSGSGVLGLANLVSNVIVSIVLFLITNSLLYSKTSLK